MQNDWGKRLTLMVWTLVTAADQGLQFQTRTDSLRNMYQPAHADAQASPFQWSRPLTVAETLRFGEKWEYVAVQCNEDDRVPRWRSEQPSSSVTSASCHIGWLALKLDVLYAQHALQITMYRYDNVTKDSGNSKCKVCSEITVTWWKPRESESRSYKTRCIRLQGKLWNPRTSNRMWNHRLRQWTGRKFGIIFSRDGDVEFRVPPALITSVVSIAGSIMRKSLRNLSLGDWCIAVAAMAIRFIIIFHGAPSHQPLQMKKKLGRGTEASNMLRTCF